MEPIDAAMPARARVSANDTLVNCRCCNDRLNPRKTPLRLTRIGSWNSGRFPQRERAGIQAILRWLMSSTRFVKKICSAPAGHGALPSNWSSQLWKGCGGGTISVLAPSSTTEPRPGRSRHTTLKPNYSWQQPLTEETPGNESQGDSDCPLGQCCGLSGGSCPQW